MVALAHTASPAPAEAAAVEPRTRPRSSAPPNARTEARGARNHAELAVAEVGRRSVIGTIGHLVLYLFAESQLGLHAATGGALTVAVVVILAVRVATVRITATGAGSRLLRWSLLYFGAVGMNVLWGTTTAIINATAGETRASVVMAFVTCGVATGAVVALAPSRWLHRAALLVLVMPVIVAGPLGAGSTSYALLHAMFLAFVWVQGAGANRDYWGAIRGTELLQDAAAASQRAADRAALTAQQLRTEIAHSAAMEVELRQAQKLEAIGRLAAGVAHEINTPIQFVGDSCHFLRSGIEGLEAALADYRGIVDDAVAGRIDRDAAAARMARADVEHDLALLHAELPTAATLAVDGLRRVAAIVSAMKQFAYPDRVAKSYADLNKAIESTLVISNNETKYVADVRTQLGALPLVLCHVGELNQVILNIVINAAHAIDDRQTAGDDRKGEIVVRTWRDGDYVKIAISDTGAGIPAAIRDKIFEPFFTTKPVGKGTGQGLAIARAVVVDKHAGRIDVASELGVGTTFTIALPIAPLPELPAA
jgi:signal transduction histidine kinase